MPPKAKITKDMVIAAGFDIVRSEGQESLNVRSIAAKLNCSTQPIMYHYKTVDELKAEVYAFADGFHSEYIMRRCAEADPVLTTGLNYIRFAYEEKYLFRFLFQSDKFLNVGFKELLNSDELSFLLEPIKLQAGLTPDQAKTVFETMFICVHGYSSLLANNSMGYCEEHCAELLKNTFMSIVGFIKREKKNEKAL